MNEQAIQEQYQHIVSLLEQKRLKEAQVQLEAFLWNCNDWTLRNRLEQAKVSYQYMLQYMQPGRKRSGTAETIPAAFGRNPGTCRTSAYQLTR